MPNDHIRRGDRDCGSGDPSAEAFAVVRARSKAKALRLRTLAVLFVFPVTIFLAGWLIARQSMHDLASSIIAPLGASVGSLVLLVPAVFTMRWVREVARPGNRADHWLWVTAVVVLSLGAAVLSLRMSGV